MKHTLLNSQHQAVKKLSRLKVGALFMEAGTGKTRAALEMIRSIPEPRQVFWFTPFQTKENLQTEIDKWGGLNCEVIGTESISQSDLLYLNIYRKISESKNNVMVVDESLKIKNSDAKRTQRIIELGKMSTYKLILNGTPLSRNLLDLWSQMEFLSPLILNMREAEFKNNFCEYKKITIHKPGTYRTRSKEWIVRYRNLDYLYKLIEPYVFECDLQIAVNKQYVNIDFDLQPEEKEQHEEIINKVLDNDWLMAKPNFFLELTQKLQNNYSRSPEKFDYVDQIIKKNNASKVVVFAKYIQTQEQLKKTFPNITVLSYQKHSYGLNLQHFNRCIFFDKVWDYALREQAERRIYRTGQQTDCVYYDLTGNVGLERMIDGNINRKADLLQEFKKLSLEEFKARAK